MRLTTEQVELTLNQIDAQPIPADHPAIGRLHEMFGDHTFFLDVNGLNVIEPAEPTDGAAAGQVVKVAQWSDDKLTQLAPHQPEPTDVVVLLETAH